MKLSSTTKPDIVVVGKIIFDEYGLPGETCTSVTIGGCGPQAAMGAALALAAREYKLHGRSASSRLPPPPQPVKLLAPVGDLDFSTSEEDSLKEIFKDVLLEPPQLVRGKGFVTPRLRVWHDQDQVLKWQPLHDSLGPSGADGLWRTTPSLEDYREVLVPLANQSEKKTILHMIIECGAEAPGGNDDSQILFDSTIRNAVSFLGLEPIFFPQEDGTYSINDSTNCGKLLQKILDQTTIHSEATVCISPDMSQYKALRNSDSVPTSVNLDSWTIRDGPRGSYLQIQSRKSAWVQHHIPAASLRDLVNPKGAGNAYAAAYTALRGTGSDALESACIATGVGVAFCEHCHCPPYTWDVVERIVQASEEVQKARL